MLALRENTVAFNKPEVVIMSFEQVQIDYVIAGIVGLIYSVKGPERVSLRKVGKI